MVMPSIPGAPLFALTLLYALLKLSLYKFKSVQIFPCPVEDYLLLKKALNDCDGIFHLAAFKDVILAKEHPPFLFILITNRSEILYICTDN